MIIFINGVSQAVRTLDIAEFQWGDRICLGRNIFPEPVQALLMESVVVHFVKKMSNEH